MAERIVEIFLINDGWFRIDFSELKEGMLFRMYEPSSMEPILYYKATRWVVLKSPFTNDGVENIYVRRYIELVGNF